MKDAPYILLPPLLARVVIENNERDPAKLAIMFREAMVEFNDLHKDDRTMNTATTSLKSILTFIWGAANKKVPPLERLADIDDSRLQFWSKFSHSQHISKATQDPDNQHTSSQTHHQLAISIQNQTDLMEKMAQARATERNERASKFDDLPDTSRQLILFASSPDGEYCPSVPVNFCANFYKQKTATKALQVLTETLQTTYGCIVRMDNGSALALYVGVFVRDVDDLQSNFSFFLVPKKHPNILSNTTKSMMLQLKVSHGQGWSDKDFVDAAKQGIRAPNNIDELKYQVENFAGKASFFFGTTSRLTTNLLKLRKQIKNNLTAFEAIQDRDPKFATSFGYGVDTRTYRWLQQCRDCTEREAVDDNLIDFTPMITDVLLDRFVQPLPSSIALIEYKGKRRNQDSATQNDDRRDKKVKEEDTPIKVTNEDMINDWKLKDREDYKIFAGQHVDLKPKIDGRFYCSRWHIRGYCFTNCKNNDTHIPSQSLPTDGKQQMCVYIQTCRGQ